MALAITWEGIGTLATAETGETFGGSAPSWGISGSGGVSASQDTEIYYQGAASYSSQISSGKNGWLFWNSSTTYDFTSGGNAYQQRIYIWYNCTTPGKMNTKATPGLAVRVGSSTSVYRTFTLAGSDDLNGYSGGWKCAVIDPTLTGSMTDSGSYNPNNVTYIGIYYNGSGSARSNNIFVDSIAIGKGIRAKHTETTSGQGMKETVDYCSGTLATRAWGAIQQREGIYYIYGKLFVGDGGNATSDTTFGTSSRVIKWGNFEYWVGTPTNAWVTSIGNDFNGLTITDSSSYKTFFTDGVLVGSDGGRSGNVYVGSDGINTAFALYGGNNVASTTYLYGSTLQNINNTITWGNDADHRCYSVNFLKDAQFDPVGAVKIRNCVFAETASTAGALKWNESIDAQKSKFIANTAGAGVQMPSNAGSPYTYTDLTFSGNTYDVNNTSGNSIEVQKSGTSNPTTYTGSTVSFTASTTLNIYLVDADGSTITATCEVTVVRNSDQTVLHQEENITDGLTTYNYTTGGGTVTYINVMNVTGYQPKTLNNYTLPSSGTVDLTIQLDNDPYYSNP